MIHWGVENELHTFLGQAQLGAMCTLFNGDFIVCSSKKTLFISLNQISKTSSYIYTTITFAEYLDMVFGIDVGLCRLSAFQPRNPTDFYLKDFPLGQQWVHQLYYDKTHNYLITVGNDIKIWSISRNRYVSSPEERLILELQSTIPSTSFVRDLKEIFVDECRSRLIVPSSNGLIVYHYDGQVAANNTNMSLDKFNTVCLRIAPVKHQRMKEKFKKELNVIPLNLYKRLFTADNEGNLLLWHRTGQLLHRFDERLQSILFSEFISAEFVILVDNLSKIYILDVKTYHTVLVNDKINKKPDRVYLLRNPDRLAISSVNEIYIFRINTLWKLWYRPISKAFTVNRFTSPHLLSRFGFFSDDGFFRLISPKGSYLIASAAVRKCATPRFVAYDPSYDDDLCIMALDDSTIQFFKIIDSNSPHVLTESDEKYDNKRKPSQLLLQKDDEKNDNDEKDVKEDIKTEEEVKDNETKKDKEEERNDKADNNENDQTCDVKNEEDVNANYEVSNEDLVRRMKLKEDTIKKQVKQTDDFHIVDSIRSNSKIVLMARIFKEKEWALISLGPSGDLNVFKWGTWEQKKRLFFDHSMPKFAFLDKPNNTLIILSQKKLSIISLETFIFNYHEFFKEAICAAYENGVLLTYAKDGTAYYYEVTDKTVTKVEELTIPTKVVSVSLQYGLHIFVFNNSTITIGNRSNFSIYSIELPFQPSAVTFTNSSTLDLLVAIDNEVMILPLLHFCKDLHPTVVRADDNDEGKSDPRVFIKSRGSRRKRANGDKKYQDAATGTNDDYEEVNSDSSDIDDYEDINSDSDDDDFTDDDEYNRRRRIKRYRKQLKKGIFKSREFKTTTNPYFDAEKDFEESFDYKKASFQPPPPRPIKTIASTFQIGEGQNKVKEPEPRKPVHLIAGKIKSGQKANVYRFSRTGLSDGDEEEEEEEEAADGNGDRIKGMFDLLVIKELTFDKETQTDETFVAKMKEREAEERRKQLLAKIAEMNKKNRRSRGKGKGENGDDSEYEYEYDENGNRIRKKRKKGDGDDSEYEYDENGKRRRKKRRKGEDGEYYSDDEDGKRKGKGKGKNKGKGKSGNGEGSEAARSRVSSTSKLSSLSKNNGRNNNSRFNRKSGKDKEGSRKGKSKLNGSGSTDLNSRLSSQNMPGDLYFNSSADAIGNRKNVTHPDGSGKNGRGGGRNGKNGSGFDGSEDFNKTPRRSKNGYGYGYGKGGANGSSAGSAYGAGGGDASGNLLDGIEKLEGHLPSKIYRRIDYDDASLFDRLNGHSPSCHCRECCDPNYKNKHKDVHLPSYRLVGHECCDHEHEHEHSRGSQLARTHGSSYIYGNDPYIGMTIENFPIDTEFRDETILCGYDSPPLDDEQHQPDELLPVVPPKTPKKKKKMPIVIPPDRLSFNRHVVRPPPISTQPLIPSNLQQRPNSCRTGQVNVLITQQDGGEAMIDEEEESETQRRPKSCRTILSTPEKEKLWQTPETAYDENSIYPQFRFASSARSNYSSNSYRSGQSAQSSAISTPRNSGRMSLRDSYVQEFENSSNAPRNLSKPILRDEGYTGYGTGFGYEFAKKAPDQRKSSKNSSRRSTEVLPPLPKIV